MNNGNSLVPITSEYLKVDPTSQIINEKGYRNIGIYLLKKHTALTNKKIGELFGGIPYTKVSKAFQRFSARLDDERNLRKTIKKIENKMSYVEV